VDAEPASVDLGPGDFDGEVAGVEVPDVAVRNAVDDAVGGTRLGSTSRSSAGSLPAAHARVLDEGRRTPGTDASRSVALRHVPVPQDDSFVDSPSGSAIRPVRNR
jgi:hypothetical protein